jgi:curli biogenesis system outer membrane secretion channel CsgG
MRRWIAILSLAIAGVSTMAAQQKKIVAVLDFDYATVKSASMAWFGTDQDIGKGIADMLIEKLVNGNSYRVIDRKRLDKILAEQNFSNSDRADPNSAAKIGRILGVSAIITGSITQFGRDDKHQNYGGGLASGVTGRFGIGGYHHNEAKAVVGITVQLINTDTGEILAAARGTGTSKRTSTSISGAGGGDIVGGGGGGVGSANFGQTIIGEATLDAVGQIASQLEQDSGKLPARELIVNGLVADATGGTIILNIGTRGGISVGDRLQVRRRIRDIKDPATGRVLRSIEDKVGEIVITEADENSAVGNFEGAGQARVGDKVTNR